MGNTPINSLGRSKFSYKNIHVNIGNVRWYSMTNRNEYKYKKPNIIKDNSYIYNQLSNFLISFPINEYTQLKIENALYEQCYISLKDKLDKSSKPKINYNLINSRFSKLLLNERSKLGDYINISRNLHFEK